MPKLFVSLAQSFLGECIMLITTILVGSYICKNAITLKTHDAKLRQETIYLRKYFFSRLYIALTVPAFFHVATIFALIWEHSSTVCTLGTLVVLSLQCLGISIVMDAQPKWNCGINMSNDKIDMPRQEKQFWAHLKQAFPFVLSLSARTLCVHVFGKMHNVGGDSSPCTGIDLFGTGSFCIIWACQMQLCCRVVPHHVSSQNSFLHQPRYLSYIIYSYLLIILRNLTIQNAIPIRLFLLWYLSLEQKSARNTYALQ